jgi:hypothetical protein
MNVTAAWDQLVPSRQGADANVTGLAPSFGSNPLPQKFRDWVKVIDLSSIPEGASSVWFGAQIGKPSDHELINNVASTRKRDSVFI